jgi:hypothetical protein
MRATPRNLDELEILDSDQCLYSLRQRGKTFGTASHAEKADVIMQLCIGQSWRDKADEYDLKAKIVSILDDGGSEDAINAVVSDFLDQNLAEEQIDEEEEDREIALWRLARDKEEYWHLCGNVARFCLSEQLVFGVAHGIRSIVTGSRFPANASAVFRPRISSALLCRVARMRVLCSSGLLEPSDSGTSHHLAQSYFEFENRTEKSACTSAACLRPQFCDAFK